MGLFALPPKTFDECSAQDFVDTAKHNIKLWEDLGSDRQNDYLVQMAISDLNNAMRKLRPIDDNDPV